MAGLVVFFVAAGVWGVYWSVVNTYHVEQKGALLQAEGERILDLIVNGGYVDGCRVHGLSSALSNGTYPVIGKVPSGNFKDMASPCNGGIPIERADCRIEFLLDDTPLSGHPRFAQFVVELWECDPGGGQPHTFGSKAVLWFALRTRSSESDPLYGCETKGPDNYCVKITENLLPRAESSTHGSNEHTWFKAQKLPDLPGGVCPGVKISFYLADSSELVKYCCNLSRLSDPPIGNPDQERAYMNSVPYPKYFSTTVYFPSRN